MPALDLLKAIKDHYAPRYIFNALHLTRLLFQSYIFCALYMQCRFEGQALEVDRKVEARIGSGQKGETFKTDKNWEWTEKGNFQN
jgi:hypothetical protein